MRTLVTVLFAGTLASIGMANAADSCGPGCHMARYGGCVIDGWGTSASLWNECPAGARPRPPCYYPFVWRARYRACFAT
jgi:hypothetical protein